MTRELTTSVGVACLVISPAALLGQAIVTPVSAGGDAAAQVADAASDLSAMRWALLLDAPLLLLVPAALFAGAVAGARRSRVAAVGAGLAFIGTLAAVFLLANDILLYEAAVSSDPGAIGLVDAYQHNALFGAMLVLYLAGQAIGCLLLGRPMAPTCGPALGRRGFGGLPDHRRGLRPSGRSTSPSPGSGPARSPCDELPSSRRQPTRPPH
jgi:hypothetical protein